MTYVLGLDLGTSALKAIVMDKRGSVISTVSEKYALHQNSEGYSEQNPNDWVRAADHILAHLIDSIPDFQSELTGISFSGQMHSLVLLDEDKEVLRPAILWNDVRTTKQCERIMTEYGEQLLEMTNNIALEGFTLPKILWVQENEPEIWKKTRHILLPKDYLRYWFTDKLHMDLSDAAGTLLLDAKTNTWSFEIIDHFNIPKEYLPPLIQSTDYVGNVKRSIANKYNFTQSIKVFGGGADNACSAIGAGILDENTALASIGTSGVFLSLDSQPHAHYHGKLHLFKHAIPNASYAMGVTLAAGHSLSWLKQLLGKNETFDDFLEDIEEVREGSEGLLFTPYISGERTPYVDSQIRGSFIGLDASHTKKHLARSVIEGITFSLKDSKKTIENHRKTSFDKIISVGGGAQNSEWLQIQANIFDAEIGRLEVEEGPGFGAAIIAAVGVGWYNSLEDCVSQVVTYKEFIQPEEVAVENYESLYAIYTEVYPATKAISHRLSRFKKIP